LNAYLWKRTGKDRIPVIVYSTALLAISLVALDCGSSQAAAGGALFLVSDTLLALEKFGDVHVPANESLVMAPGAASPARAQALSRAAARTARIAFSARGASAASLLTRRDTTGSEATGPNN
jgi:uncharacterized membrane protein YhhN